MRFILKKLMLQRAFRVKKLISSTIKVNYYKIMKYQHKQQAMDSQSQSEQMEQVYSEQSQSEESSENEEQQQEIMQMEMKRIKQQLKNVPYELILKQKEALIDNKGNLDKHGKTKKIAKPKKNKKHVKVNQEKHEKNEAVQVSIYQRPKRNNQTIFNQKKKGIDPRFQSYAGNYNPDLAMKTYDFIPKLQQAEIQQLRAKLKGKTKRHKLTPHEREVLSNEYNVITNAYKQGQLLQLQQKTKSELKQKHGSDYHIGKREFNQQFQRKKLQNMNQGDREKKIKEKRTKMMRNQLHQRRKVLHFKTK